VDGVSALSYDCGSSRASFEDQPDRKGRAAEAGGYRGTTAGVNENPDSGC